MKYPGNILHERFCSLHDHQVNRESDFVGKYITNMINMDNIPGGMISGLDEELLTFVTEESSERFVHEISSSFFNELEAIEKMDKVLSDEEEQKLIELEASSNSVATDKQTKMWVTKLKEFLKSRDLLTYFETSKKSPE